MAAGAPDQTRCPPGSPKLGARYRCSQGVQGGGALVCGCTGGDSIGFRSRTQSFVDTDNSMLKRIVSVAQRPILSVKVVR